MNILPITDSMSEVTAGLLLFIQSHLGLFNSIEPPHIEFMPVAEIVEIACNQPCGDIKGWTPALGNTVYLSNELSINRDMFDRSIVLHELVHYVQYKYQLTNMATDCLTWKAREAQAYQLQFLWLQEHKVSFNSLSLNIAMQNFHRVQCPPTDDSSVEL